MLNLFKSNNPGVVIFYIFYLAVFRIYFFFSPAPFDPFAHHSEPLSRFVQHILTVFHANSAFWSCLLSSGLCFAQALLINKLVNDNKILPRKNYLAGLLFVIIASFFKEGALLSPALLSLTFIILSCIRMFELIRKEKAPSDIFDIGLLIAVATLFYFPCILLLVFMFFGLATVRPFSFREWVIALTGFLIPFYFVFVLYFWYGHTRVLPDDIANIQAEKWLTGASMGRSDVMVLSALLVFALAALSVLPAALYSSLIQVRKYATILMVLVLLVAVSFSLQQQASLCHWVLLALPLSVIFSLALMQIRRRLILEIIHLMLILLPLAGQYLPLLHII